MGAPLQAVFNFHPAVRPVPLDIHIQSFDQIGFQSRMLAMYKPVYQAIRRHAGDRPAIVFAPSKKITWELVIELRTCCAGETQFLQCDPANAQHKDLLQRTKASAGLTALQKSAIEYGIGFLTEGQSQFERDHVTKLYRIGLIQVIVASYTLCWQLDLSAHTVVIAGTQFYDGKEHRHADYYVTDLLQMLGRACRPLMDEQAVAVVMCHSSKKDYLMKTLFESYSVESHLDHYIVDHINAEIVSKSIETQQDAIDYLTWTFLYRRLKQNPNYYKMYGVTHEHISEYMSELVENSVRSLREAGCITMETERGDDGENKEVLAPANLGIIAAYYYIQYMTVELFASSITAKHKMKDVIAALSSACEFEELLIRHHEEEKLERLSRHCPVRIQEANFSDPHTKVNILLQSHFSRMVVNPDLEVDQREVLPKCIPLLSAMVDVVGSSRWLTPLFACMELSQMIVQGMWDKDSIFMQFPHFTPEHCMKCKAAGLETVFDFVDMDDGERNRLFNLSQGQMVDVARFCNGYPNIEMKHQVLDADDLHENSLIAVAVQLERELDENATLPRVHCPRFPKEKEEGWWVVIGDEKKSHVYAVKRLVLQRRAKVKMEFQGPKQGKHDLRIYLMSDCYIGCDQEYDLADGGITVGEPLEDESVDDMSAD